MAWVETILLLEAFLIASLSLVDTWSSDKELLVLKELGQVS